MSDEASSLEFPPDPAYYSVVQTSPLWRKFVISSLLVVTVVASWAYGSAYIENPEEFGLGGILAFAATISVLLALVLIILLASPFFVENGVVHLMKSVRRRSGRRTRLIPLAEISDVTVIPDARDRLQIWVTLKDRTKFRMVTMEDEKGKDFARRFANHFQGRGR